ncbi:hypothetical protein LCGC14_2655140 [marine sediment metagenome]|uniref:Uncharacterized protein n=1 Tax=marine sediment metagenome TaxID=412755 RepID=A0A0F9C3Z8_9ZZZZ
MIDNASIRLIIKRSLKSLWQTEQSQRPKLIHSDFDFAQIHLISILTTSPDSAAD